MYGGSGIAPCASSQSASGRRACRSADGRTGLRARARWRVRAAGERDRRPDVRQMAGAQLRPRLARRRRCARPASPRVRRWAWRRRTRALITRVSLNTTRSPRASQRGRSAKRRSTSVSPSTCSSRLALRSRRRRLRDQLRGQLEVEVLQAVGLGHGRRAPALRCPRVAAITRVVREWRRNYRRSAAAPPIGVGVESPNRGQHQIGVRVESPNWGQSRIGPFDSDPNSYPIDSDPDRGTRHRIDNAADAPAQSSAFRFRCRGRSNSAASDGAKGRSDRARVAQP